MSISMLADQTESSGRDISPLFWFYCSSCSTGGSSSGNGSSNSIKTTARPEQQVSPDLL